MLFFKSVVCVIFLSKLYYNKLSLSSSKNHSTKWRDQRPLFFERWNQNRVPIIARACQKRFNNHSMSNKCTGRHYWRIGLSTNVRHKLINKLSRTKGPSTTPPSIDVKYRCSKSAIERLGMVKTLVSFFPVSFGNKPRFGFDGVRIIFLELSL